jgi:hypothetical protein
VALVFLATAFIQISQGGEEAMAFEISSTAFQAQGNSPKKFSCEDADISPALEWSNPPAGAQSFALIVDDPDAPVGTWVHWVVYDIPASARGLSEGLPKDETLPDGSKQGVTDFGRVGYGGPCPPPGKPHRYFFKLYALDTQLNLPPRKKKDDLLKAIKGHVLAEVQLIGLYKRG